MRGTGACGSLEPGGPGAGLSLTGNNKLGGHAFTSTKQYKHQQMQQKKESYLIQGTAIDGGTRAARHSIARTVETRILDIVEVVER